MSAGGSAWQCADDFVGALDRGGSASRASDGDGGVFSEARAENDGVHSGSAASVRCDGSDSRSRIRFRAAEDVGGA